MATKEQPRPKLRSSCDACQALKIKCGQEKPSCRRCLSSRLDCVYGVSRRMGKPRSGTRAVTEKPPSSPSPSSQGKSAATTSLSTEPPPLPPPPPSRDADTGARSVESNQHAPVLLDDDDGRQSWSPSLPLWNLDAADILSSGSDMFEDFSASHSIASPSDNSFMTDHYSRSTRPGRPVPLLPAAVGDDAVTTDQTIVQENMTAGEGVLCTTGSRRSAFTDRGLLFDQSIAGAATPSSSSSDAAAISGLAASLAVPFNTTLINHLSPEKGSGRQSCNCYVFALQSLVRLERVSKSHGDLVFDTILAFARETLCHCFGVLECSLCLENSSCLLIYSLLVGKITLLCQTGCSAYGIYKDSEKGQGRTSHTRQVCTTSAVKVGNYEVRGEEEKLLVGVLMQRRLREVSDILGRLSTAAQKLPHDRESNACRDVIADAYQKLGSITGCPEL